MCLFLYLQPALFENIVNETIQHLHEVVVQNKTGEPEVSQVLGNSHQYVLTLSFRLLIDISGLCFLKYKYEKNCILFIANIFLKL